MAEERQKLLDEEGDVSSSGPRNESRPVKPMSALCDPRRLLHRIFVLLFMCFLGFGEQGGSIKTLWREFRLLSAIRLIAFGY